MTKIQNTTSNCDDDVRALRDDELDAVSGAVFGADDVIAITIAVVGGALIGYWAGTHSNQGNSNQGNNCGGGTSGTSTKH